MAFCYGGKRDDEKNDDDGSIVPPGKKRRYHSPSPPSHGNTEVINVGSVVRSAPSAAASISSSVADKENTQPPPSVAAGHGHYGVANADQGNSSINRNEPSSNSNWTAAAPVVVAATGSSDKTKTKRPPRQVAPESAEQQPIFTRTAADMKDVSQLMEEAWLDAVLLCGEPKVQERFWLAQATLVQLSRDMEALGAGEARAFLK